MCDDDELHFGVSDEDFEHLSSFEGEAVELESVENVFPGSSDFDDDDLALEETEFGDAHANVAEEKHDTDWKVFPISVTAADDVCIKLNELIQSSKIPKDKIFYKYLTDTVHVMLKYDHQYDSDVVEFFNTIEYLGGGKTFNFLRGPVFHGQGRGGIRKVEDSAMNLGGPSKRTRDKRRGGFTTKSGVLKDLQLAFLTEYFFYIFLHLHLLTLANDKTSIVPPLLETEAVKVIGVAMENDDTPLFFIFQFLVFLSFFFIGL